MASFDLISAVGHAYHKTWNERKYLLRMAVIPLLVKYICYAIAVTYIGTDNILRLSLIMVPAYFLEGWLLSHWVRTIVLDHRWPFRPSGDEQKDMAQLQKRGRGVMGSTIAFTLINLLMAGYFAFFVSYLPMDMATASAPQEPDPLVAMVGMIMLVSTLLLFRFIWVYIPLAVNYPIKLYAEKLKRILLTFNMIGVWLVCFIPMIIFSQMLSGIIDSIGSDERTAAMLDGFGMFIRIFLDMVKNLLCTAGMTYAFIELFGWKKKS